MTNLRDRIQNNFAILILLFILALTGGRLVWLDWFMPVDQPYADNGVLDLRSWDAASGRTVTLDGQWEFYPNTWLIPGADEPASRESDMKLIEVPGSWDEYLQPERPVPYGYGSYRLRILVDPDLEYTYSIYNPSVRSSSRLYVNGRLAGGAGEPASVPEQFVSGNVPYAASFASEGRSEIEIVVQAANFADPRSGGMIRSLKFGLEDAVQRERQLSVAMQQLMAAALLIQAVYTLVLYGMNRNRKLFYFSLMLFSTTVLILNSSEDKVLHQWFAISYEWSFKLLNISIVMLTYALIQCLIEYCPSRWRARMIRSYNIVCLAALLLALLLPVSGQIMLRDGYSVIMAVPVIVLTVNLLRTALRGIRGNLLLFLASVAFSNNFAWWSFFLVSGMKVMYYPFDLLIALILFSSIWFKQYFELYAEQKELADKLQRMNKKKDEFLANTAHELRNPLHVIINISQIVLEREKKSIHTDSIHHLELVLSVGRRMSLLLNDLLDAARLKDNHIRLHCGKVSLQPIVHGVTDMVRPMAEGKPVALVNRIPDHFPDVYADENRLIQIVFNLMHNAVKFTNDGEVSVEAYVKDGEAHIVVTDTGIGMDEGTVSRVFEPYEQASSGENEGGFGLGLSIGKQLIELHGGTIHVRSEPGRGTAFTFTLQLYDTSMQDEGTERHREEVGHPYDRTPPMPAATAERSGSERASHVRVLSGDRSRILAVDDDPVNLNILSSILSHEIYDIVTVTCADEAMKLIDAQEWDLIISDVMMPNMSGYELTRNIRRRYALSELPVLLLTARNRPEDIENGFVSGANDYVSKPVDARELQSRVRALSQLKKSARDRLRMETAWLKAQIEPHFFFNTLNSIAALQEFDKDKMRELIEHFGSFLQEKFKFQNSDELVPLEDELTLVRSYLFIQKVRYGERLQVSWEIDDGLQLLIPPFTIQPLVENAIHHGIMRRKEGGLIVIRAAEHEHDAVISVTDNGVGIKEETIRRVKERVIGKTSGIGLLNVEMRLRRLYGGGLTFESRMGEGTKISFAVRRPQENS